MSFHIKQMAAQATALSPLANHLAFGALISAQGKMLQGRVEVRLRSLCLTGKCKNIIIYIAITQL